MAGASTRERGGAGVASGRYGLEIRVAHEADAAGLAALLAASGHSVVPALLATRLAALRRETGTALIAHEWGPPSGLVVLHWYRTLEADAPTAEITSLLVGPDERRRGIGRLLLKSASQAARAAGCATLRLSAAPDQDALADFCRATGFAQAETGFVRALRKKG